MPDACVEVSLLQMLGVGVISAVGAAFVGVMVGGAEHPRALSRGARGGAA